MDVLERGIGHGLAAGRTGGGSTLSSSWLQALVLGALAAVCPDGALKASDVPPRRLLEVVDFSAPVVSPDGRHVAFRTEQASVERNTYGSVWYVQAMEGSVAPRRVADGGVPLRDSAGMSLPVEAVWSPDGRWIYYTARVDGQIGVWRAAADGSGAEPVTRDAADVRGFSLSGDGRRLLYRTGATREQVAEAEQAEYDRGIRIDRTVPIGQNLFRSLDVDGRWATQRYEGTWFGLLPLLADVPDRWKTVDLASGEVSESPASDRPVPPLQATDLADGVPTPWKLVAQPGGPRIAVLTRVGKAEGELDPPDVELSMLANRSSTRPLVCASPLCTGRPISGIQWRPGGDEIVFTVTDPAEGLAQSIVRWNVATGEVTPVVQARGLLSGGRDRSSACGVSEAALACVAAEADRPPRLERIDLDSGARQVLFEPNAALASDMAASAPARLLRWKDERGNAFTGQLFEARGAEGVAVPLFVTYYNCSGFLRGGVGDEWPLVSLAGHGISALCINSSPGYLIDPVERYGRGVSAVRSIVEALAAEGRIDPSRVGMGGLSFGSEVTYWTAIQTDLLAAASVASTSIEPNYYLFSTLRDDVFFDSLMELWGLGAPDETPAQWEALSPVYHLDRLRAPILFQMSEQEYLFALAMTLPLVRRGQADLYVFPHEPHQKFQPRHKLAAFERNLDWFRFWLKGEEDADPRKAGQYAHWRGIRDAQATRETTRGRADQP